jgi:IMP dehydrogenase
MVKITPNIGRTFGEYSLMPGFTKKDCVMRNINLSTDLAGIVLKIPLMSAAMTSVTEYEMALALGKEGGMGILPTRLSSDAQAEIVKKIKTHEMAFVEDPLAIKSDETVEMAMRFVGKRGHSAIPVVDKNNVFVGMFSLQHYWDSEASIHDIVTKAMILPKDLLIVDNPDIKIEEAKNLFEEKGVNRLIALDREGRLEKMAFRKDMEKIKVGVAISTHKGWENKVKKTLGAGADLVVIDTSDAHNEFTKDVLQKYKSMKFNVPVCAGNVVTYEAAEFLMDNGADMVKVGMSSGSICITQREKATGRAPMTALMEVGRARNDHFKKTGKYVSVIIDGGISSAADMIIALTIADAIMMGGYFNKFYEAAAEKLDEKGKETRIEAEMYEVATWGEGSHRAKNLDRYGQSRKTFFAEGVEGTVNYGGRLKPTLKTDVMKIKGALSNTGCMNLKEFRDKAVIEIISPFSSQIITNPHDMKKQ